MGDRGLSVGGRSVRRVTHLVFFFQAEDGIRDRNVTGVQTCALPISAGVDALLCPGIVCPPDPAFGGTAATLFWGFEGSLSEVQARSLLLLSQILLAGIAQFPRAVEVQHQSILAGMERGAERTLHQLPKDIAALHRDFH